jgi:hypothetical protein
MIDVWWLVAAAGDTTDAARLWPHFLLRLHRGMVWYCCQVHLSGLSTALLWAADLETVDYHRRLSPTGLSERVQ